MAAQGSKSTLPVALGGRGEQRALEATGGADARLLLPFSFNNLFIFNWRIITFQYCVDFCQTPA